jgi:hypothetical protein
MFCPAVQNEFDEIPIPVLNSEAAVCYLLDAKLRLKYCNEAWERFAAQNGAPGLFSRRLLGTCILDCISGKIADYYRSLYLRALSSGTIQQQRFHCSSPSLERLMVMRVCPLRATRSLLTVCSTRVERPHLQPPSEALESLYRNVQGLIVMCSNCRRTRRAGALTVWDWVPDFVERLPTRVSHGLCGLCLQYYRWDLRSECKARGW